MSGARAEVLGPVRIRTTDGRVVPVAGALPRRLLAALALAGPAGRTAEALVDDVWADEAPRNPRAALQMLVSRVRATAGDGLLESTPAGYRVAASDLGDAEAAAVADADDAIGGWRGEPGADLDEPGLAGALRQRADAALAALLDVRARALLDAGRPEAAADDARRLVALRPLDGEPVLLLLEALEARGRPAEALAAYADHAALLADALGTDPDPAVAAAHLRLLRAVERTELVGVRTGRDPLLGRDADLAAIATSLRTARLVTVIGPGGMGKTRIAHEAAADAPGFGRAVFVELAGTRTADDVLAAVAQTAGARGARTGRLATEPPAPDLAARTADALAAPRTLLVVDNCEQVVDGAAALADDLLAAVPDLVVLATSRVPLLVPGEHLHPLPPLPTDTDAAALFERRARAARPDVRLDAVAVRRVVAHLDGLPLAIELAAARLRSMTLAELEARLADRFAVLVGGSRTAPERHRTLFAVIDWSWRLLPPDQQRAAALLGAFPDGCTAASARVALGPGADALLVALVDQSLLVFQELPRPRYRMLETVREFAASAAERTGLAAEGRDAVDAAALAIVHDAGGLTGTGAAAAIDALAAEEETLRAVLREAPEGRERAVVGVAAALLEYWAVRGEFESVADALPHALAAARRPGRDDAERAALLRVLVLAATVAVVSGDPSAARTVALLRRALRDGGGTGLWPAAAALILAPRPLDAASPVLAGLLGSADPVVATFGAVVRSQLLENAGRSAEALADAQRAGRLAERHGLPWLGLLAGGSVVQLHSQRGERAAALAAGEALETSAFARAAGTDRRQQDWLMGVNLAAVGRLEEARVRFERLAALPHRARAEEAEDVHAIALAGLATVATGPARSARWAEALSAARRASAPWTLLIRAAAAADAVERGDRAEAGRLGRGLRGRTLALIRLADPRTDRPILASAALGVAVVLLDEPETADLGRRLGAAAIDGGARVDLPALERARAAFLPHEPAEGDAVETIRALLVSWRPNDGARDERRSETPR